MPPTVTVLGTGGTIASTAGEAGATPELSADDLLAAVPAIEDHAAVRTEQVAQTPSFDMDFGTLARVGRAVRDASADADGVVVTHGTDTMEESAYFLDLTLDTDVPVVLTGAQRRPDEPSPDGPANLLTAVRAASHDALAGEGGVYVAFDEKLHAARAVRKLHTSDLGTFESPDAGPVAALSREGATFFREPGSHSPTLPLREPASVVRTVASGVGVDGRQVERAVEDGADGIVLEGVGLGNATAALGEAVADAVDRGVPVVVTSRCVGGTTAAVYGTPGGGEGLRERGAVHAGRRSTAKARIELALLENRDPAAVREHFRT